MNNRLTRSGLLVVGVLVATLGVAALTTMNAPDTPRTPSPPPSASIPQPSATGERSPGLTPASSPPVSSPPASSLPAATPTPAPVATASPTPSPADLVAAFIPQLAEALRNGDAAFAIAHLHPDTLARYGAAQCLQDLLDRADPAVEITVVEIGQPEAWDYETDGLATRIEDAVPVLADMTMDGVTGRSVLHLTVEAGVVRWFTDCGLPIDTPVP